MYRINEIFYSLQGEGRNTGRAAVFVRFAGCNLHCSFCDTQFEKFSKMSGDDIITAITTYPARFVVLTGGEPTLQVDEPLIDLLHEHGYEVAMESNGTRPAPRNLDWLTVSPKTASAPAAFNSENSLWRMPDELKVVFQEDTHPEDYIAAYSSLLARSWVMLYLQPCDTGDASRNAFIMKSCIQYIEQHPQWRLSLQTHKLIGIQ